MLKIHHQDSPAQNYSHHLDVIYCSHLGFLYKSASLGFSSFSIFEFPIIHFVCPQILHKPLFSNALGNMQCPQEHLKTIVYAKFGGQTNCIMGNSKIGNAKIYKFDFRIRGL